MRKLLILFLLSASVVTQAQILSAKDIIKKSEDKIRGGENAVTAMTIDIVRPTWQRTMKLKTWAKGQDYSMILITEPKRDKGQVFLKNKKQVWNYIPRFNRVTKLPPTAMSQSWMGTDLSNDDLIRESNKADDFTYKKLKDTVVDGLKAYHIELTPTEGANVIWGKINLIIDQNDFITLRNFMYDEDGSLVNTLKAQKIQVMGGIKMATQLEMIPNDKVGHKTVMTINSLDTQQVLTENFFTKQNMKKVK